MLAAIIENKPETAEWFWLIASILALAAAVLSFPSRPTPPARISIRAYAGFLAWLGVSFYFFGSVLL